MQKKKGHERVKILLIDFYKMLEEKLINLINKYEYEHM